MRDGAAYSIFFLFATSMSAGVAAVLPFVSLRAIGRRFFVLMSLIALAFIVLAAVSRGIQTGYLHFVCAGFLIAYNVFLPKEGKGDGRSNSSTAAALFSQSMLVGAIVAGSVGVGGDALVLAGRANLQSMPPELVVASCLSSAVLVGASLVAMVLGHWYLVVRGLSFGPLSRLTAVLTVALAVRLAVTASAVWSQAGRWDQILSEAGFVSFFLGEGVFVAARVLFGFLAPLVMVKLVWDCLKAESNQSATGILYVMVAFILIGELLAKHCLLTPGLCL